MSDSLEPAKKRLKEIKQFRDKANMLASAHNVLSDRYGKQYSRLSTLTLVVSTFLVAAIFSDDFVVNSTSLSSESFTWIKGGASVVNFSLILLISKWNLQDKAAQHRTATQFYFSIINQIREWIDSQNEITPKMIEQIRMEYGSNDSIPKIPEEEFLKLKQQHLQKVAISRELPNQPFSDLQEIEVYLKQKANRERNDDQNLS